MELNRESLGTAQAITGRTKYQTIINSGNHTTFTDEPESENGTDTAMPPFSLLMASLASCTSITLRMYIDRKMWVVDEIKVDVEMFSIEGGTMFERRISFTGDLTDEQRERLELIADKCPVHKILVGDIMVDTKIV